MLSIVVIVVASVLLSLYVVLTKGRREKSLPPGRYKQTHVHRSKDYNTYQHSLPIRSADITDPWKPPPDTQKRVIPEVYAAP